jgi:hypothetical protein
VVLTPGAGRLVGSGGRAVATGVGVGVGDVLAGVGVYEDPENGALAGSAGRPSPLGAPGPAPDPEPDIATEPEPGEPDGPDGGTEPEVEV